MQRKSQQAMRGLLYLQLSNQTLNQRSTRSVPPQKETGKWPNIRT